MISYQDCRTRRRNRSRPVNKVSKTPPKYHCQHNRHHACSRCRSGNAGSDGSVPPVVDLWLAYPSILPSTNRSRNKRWGRMFRLPEVEFHPPCSYALNFGLRFPLLLFPTRCNDGRSQGAISEGMSPDFASRTRIPALASPSGALGC